MMGCSTSRIDRLPAVSLCHDRCNFLGEALYQSYAVADAHVAYFRSLKTIGPSLRRFVDLNPENVSDNFDVKSNPLKPAPSLSSSSSPDHHSNPDPHLDFPTDSEDEIEEFGEIEDFDLLHSTTQTPGFGGVFEAALPPYGGSAWKTPPPPPPIGSHWEFLNFFDAYERYDLPPLAKEEIHELKNENRRKDKVRRDYEKPEKEEEKKKQSKSKLNVKKTEKKQNKTEETERPENRRSSEVIREIEAKFERAADSGNEVLKILDTGKFRYYDKNSIYQSVSSKMLQVVSSSILAIPSKNKEALLLGEEKIDSACIDEEVDVFAINLSSTLKKLSMWEKKLYDEVKAEEKLRIVVARGYRQIENMDEKKVDSARTLIRALSTKIRVSIQVIDKTSITINKLRDEELWPFITQLIHKQLGMWKAMQECHKCQCEVVVEAKSLDAILSGGKFNESHLESAIELKLEIQKWNLNFSSWITAQKCYVKALNGWLLKCLPYESEEEMPDKTRPPAVIFAFCDRWSHAASSLSKTEVISAMDGLFMIIDQFVQRHYVDLEQRLSVDKDLEKRMRILERKEKMMQRVVQARGKKMFPSTGGAVHQSEVIQNTSLEFGLKQIFKAVEKFAANNVQIYEELCAASNWLN